MDVFEMDASAIKSLMSSTYIIIKKANCQAFILHYTNLIFAVMLFSFFSFGILSHTFLTTTTTLGGLCKPLQGEISQIQSPS